MTRIQRGMVCTAALVALALTACEPPRGTPSAATQPASPAASETLAAAKPPTPPVPPAPPNTAPATAIEQMQQKAQEALQNAGNWATEMRDKYWNNARDELNKLVERAKEATSGMKPEIERRIKELQERATDAAKALETARKAGGQAFEDARKRFEQTIDEYRRAVAGEASTQPASRPATAPARP